LKTFLGADVGSTKTHVLIADETGKVIGFGRGGPGNHESVGYEGFQSSLQEAARDALKAAGLAADAISGAGFGVSGYDWPSETEPTLRVIRTLGLHAPLRAVNDAILGILAGSPDGWGIAVVSGTGCNCWGWDLSRERIAQMTGGGTGMGEGAGGSELVDEAVRRVAHAWTGRGPATRLTQAFMDFVRAADPIDLIDGLMNGRYRLTAKAAPLIFQAAAAEDSVALDVIRWGGCELGEMAVAVIRRLKFEALAFDVVQVGSLFEGSPLLAQTMMERIQPVAPQARLVKLAAPAVIGAVLLAMEQVDIRAGEGVRVRLNATAREAIRPK
jgi:N-acetylglucosamine kinase-like BadF-type ATPase